MKKNYEEILKILKEKINTVSEFVYEDYGKTNLKLGVIEVVYKEGGEGEGEHWERVFHFIDQDIYIKVTGLYTSYNGTSFDEGWDSCEEVRPFEKIVTFYE